MPSFRTPHVGKSFTPGWIWWGCVSCAKVPALSFSWETRRSRHPAWTGISVCPGCVKGSETSSPATTPSGPGIPQARSRACQSYLPGGVAGVSKGTKETGKGKEKRQRKVGEGTGKTGTAAEGTPENNHCPPCPARAFPAEYRPTFSEGTGTGGKSGVAGQSASTRKTGTPSAFQALAW